MVEILWRNRTEYILIAIPLFILLGEILLRSGIATKVYAAIAEWLSWLPGGLMHANIGACAMFAATSGSSVATAATIGTVAEPEIRRHGYGERLRSEEHTSELQSLMRISYAVFCLKQKNRQ